MCHIVLHTEEYRAPTLVMWSLRFTGVLGLVWGLEVLGRRV